MKMKKLILLTFFIVAVSSTVAASYSLTVTAENSEGELVTADEICVNSNCVEREFSHTFSVPENQDATITIQDSEYENIQTSEYVFADMDKTYTLQQTDQNVELKIEAVNNEGENIMADEICVNSNCVEREFSHTFSVPENQDVSVSIEDSLYENIQKSVYVFSDMTKTYELSRTEETGPELNAEFSFSPENPEVEEWVEFDASDSQGDIEKYHWDFGDGDTYTDDDPEVSHKYNEEGTYEVELTVEDQDGDTDRTTTTTKTVEVQEAEEPNEAPEVSLENPGDGKTISLPYTLTWDASDPDSDDVESTVYIADERDDESDIDENNLIEEDVGSSESFELESSALDEGDYMWQVIAADENGAKTRSDVRTFTVGSEEEKNLEARFSYSPSNPEVEEWVNFDASDSQEDIEKYHWDFGDGDTYTDDDPELSHRYNEPGSYEVELNVEDSDGDTNTTTKTVEVSETTEESGSLDVFVEDDSGNPLDAEVFVDHENGFTEHTGTDGETSFELEPGTFDITASKDGYRTKTQRVSLDPGENEDITFTLRETDREPDNADLEVHVEDDGYDDLEDARVTVENGEEEIRYTDSDGDANFHLEPDNYDIEVECNDEEEHRSVNLDEGEDETVDVRFDEEFESDICGEESEDDDDRDDTRDDDDKDADEGLAITDISYPNSVCRGSSFRAEVRIENRGGFHELVTLTGSGLGSINTGQSFSLDIAETKSASIRFTNVEGSGNEEFDIRATNHDSDETTETIDVRDCGASFPDTGGDFDSGEATGITSEVSPKKTVVGDAVKVKGYVDGVRGRSQVTIRANGERKATVSTQPDGYYVAYIRLDQVGENVIKVSSGRAETQNVVKAIPTSTLTGVSAPEKVFEGESFEICTNVDSQIEPKVFLLRDGKIVDSTLADGEVCFERTASKIGEHEFRIKSLTYGKESSSPTTTTEVLEVDSEVTNFPDKVATTESEEGMVKVELYNTHNDLRRYNVKLNGIKSTWLSQSEEEVILNKGEKETVYFYLTPEEEGNFEPTVRVVSRDTTIYSEEINVYAGGTKNLRKPSFFGRISQFFGF